MEDVGNDFGGHRLGGHGAGHSSAELVSMDVTPREHVADAGAISICIIFLGIKLHVQVYKKYGCSFFCILLL